MPWKVLVGLIVCNLVWSANPTAGKILLLYAPPQLVAWLRFASAFTAYLLAAFLNEKRGLSNYFAFPKRPLDILCLLAIGLFAFCFSPLLQTKGLAASRATENALIVAMEPLLTAAFAWVFLREALSKRMLAAFAIALLGFGFLSGISFSGLSLEAHALGNVLMLLSLVGEGVYSVAGRSLMGRNPAQGIFGSALFLGVSFLTIVLAGVWGLPVFMGTFKLTARAWLALLWLGPVGTTATYFYWMRVLKQAPVATLAITLFVQPVFGALLGYALLDERLASVQLWGAGLIVAAVVIGCIPLSGRVKS